MFYRRYITKSKVAVFLFLAILLIPEAHIDRTDKMSVVWGSEERGNYEITLAGTEEVNEEGSISINVHLQTLGGRAKLSKAQMEVSYDRDKIEFLSCEGGQVEDKGGSLNVAVSTNRSVHPLGYKNYVEKIVNLKFRPHIIGKTSEKLTTVIKVTGAKVLDDNNAELVLNKTSSLPEHNINIYSSLMYDYNDDGLISAGDIGKASRTEGMDLLRNIARQSGFYPYKRVFYFGFDGAGAGFGKKFNHTGKSDLSTYTTPAMDKFLEGGIVTFSSRACMPSFSGNNWTAILHGINTNKVEKPFKIYNRIAASKYFPEENRYKSFLKVAREAMPNRRAAAYVVWSPIVNGILEKSIGVERVSTLNLPERRDLMLKNKIVEYIESGKAKNMSVFFGVFNSIDSSGHKHGWFTDSYYKEMMVQDRYFGEILRAIKKQKLLEDSLIIVNSDHGGKDKSHGGRGNEITRTFIGLNGRTVNKGKVIHGGENRDIPSLVAAGLNITPDPSWQGKVFNDNIFLNQRELSVKNGRDVERLSLKRDKECVTLNISNLKNRNLRVVDAAISGNMSKLNKIEPKPGVDILSVYMEKGLVRIIALSRKPLVENQDILAVSFFRKGLLSGSKAVNLEQAMLGAENGEEIFVNLD